jgi:hypothetical protein
MILCRYPRQEEDERDEDSATWKRVTGIIDGYPAEG